MSQTKTEFILTARDETSAAFRSAENSFGSLAKAATGVFAGFSTAAFAGKLVSVQREFDVLNASMITMTGSAANAAKEFVWIKEFAATTPFSLNQVTGAFVKLKALGLDATQESLASYGNTASAMGKSLEQFIEAVADAATSEFERLKEFGIKASKSGEDVSFTFQGVTTKIGNNAEEITGYLNKIGNNQFAGAMAERAKTLDGALSNLSDTWDELFRTINQGDAGGLIASSVGLANSAITDATVIIKALNTAQLSAAEGTNTFSSAQNGLRTIFETVAILGLNVKYVLTQVGNELGGLAAQAARVAALDFRGAGVIGDLMKQDAAASRQALDAAEKRVFNARQIAQDIRGLAALSDGLDPKVKPPKPPKPPATPKGTAEVDAADTLLKTLDKQIAVRALDLTSTEKLTAAEKEAAETQQQLNSGALKATASQRLLIEGKLEFLVAADKEIAKQNEYNTALQTADQAMIDHRQKMIESIGTAEDLATTYGLTESQLSVVTQSRLEDALAIAEANGASESTIEYLQEEIRLRGLLTDALIKVDGKRIEQQGAAEEKTNEFAAQAARSMQGAMADFLFDPFADGADGMVKKFGSVIQRMAADAAAAQIGKYLFGDLGSGGKSGDGGAIAGAGKWLSEINWSKLFSFESGGIMTSAGALPLNKYANGGIANSPQMAMFGEGRNPEAYVPLPDGRSIPVKMAGGGGGNNITINVNSQTGDSAEIRRSAAAGARSALGIIGGSQRYA